MKRSPATSVQDFSSRVAVAARVRLSKYEWFRGVCMDGVQQFYPNRFQEAVDHAVIETIYWDGFPYAA